MWQNPLHQLMWGLTHVSIKEWWRHSELLEPLDRIELRFDEIKVREWMVAHWHWSIYFSLLYVMCVYLGGRYMADKRPFDLRKPVTLWSFSLSLFSLIGFLRIADYVLEQPMRGGWTTAMCDVSYYRGVRGKKLYAFLFPLSKLPELCDTFFIILRKSPLSFLHWYHHVTVFIYCWFSYAYPMSSGIWFGFMNYGVHSIMYAYYAIRANGHIPIPKFVNKAITLIQLSQMVVGVIINAIIFRAFMNGVTCGIDTFQIQISIVIYASYGILFANFFYQNYIKKRNRNYGTKLNPELELRTAPERSRV